MRIKVNLKEKLLSFFENHRKVEVRAVMDQFNPDGTPQEIKDAVGLLEKEGWIKINRSYADKGYNISRPIILRTNKTLYAQPKMFSICF